MQNPARWTFEIFWYLIWGTNSANHFLERGNSCISTGSGFESTTECCLARTDYYCWRLSNVQNPSEIPLYWLIYKDPYNGISKSPCNWVAKSPLHTPNNQGQPFFCVLEAILKFFQFWLCMLKILLLWSLKTEGHRMTTSREPKHTCQSWKTIDLKVCFWGVSTLHKTN